MDNLSKKQRSSLMRAVRTHHTSPEERLASLLRTRSIRHRRHDSGLPGKPDFRLTDRPIVVFVHGCFWHGHVGCLRGREPHTNVAFWKRKIQGNRTRDARITRQLRYRGFSVLTVWSCELSHPERVLAKITLAMKRRGGHS